MKKELLSLLAGVLFVLPMQAQRMAPKMGRGVVAVDDGKNNVTVSWRKLAQEPEGCKYNLYRRAKGTSDYVKVNSEPLTVTSYRATTSSIPYNTELAVALVDTAGVEGEKSVPYYFKKLTWRDTYFDFNFDNTQTADAFYTCKYVWPADADGNGERDVLVVTRLNSQYNTVAESTHKLQGYRLDGTLLWTIDVGPNIDICAGQNDMVTVGDINCDGRDEVIIKSSDGTRFWDAAANTWGNYPFGKTSGDTDGDGVIDYRPSTTKIPPFYITVVDALTGAEITSAELKYSEVHDGVDSYSRSNRSKYMNDAGGTEYAFMGGHFAIAYEDGVHPSVMMECLDRTTDKTHHNYMFAFGYDWSTGRPMNFSHQWTWSRNDKSPWPAEFHGVRVADVDGDGIDELINGGASVNTTKNMVASAGIGHGDRFRVSDINPDRPGMEEYAIQQSNLLGQLIWDPATGEHLVENYLNAVGDVGRGECMDVDATHKGWEYYSTMGNLYDCNGNVVKSGETEYPYEGIWWDADVLREYLGSPGGSGNGSNVYIKKYGGDRLIQPSSESAWAVHAGWAVRPGFVGDVTGDWREEVILFKQNETTSTGLVGYSTEIPSGVSIYALMQDPHYLGDCSTRGYYQSPNTGFYLGADMPLAPLPPFVITDLRFKGGQWGSAFTTFDMSASETFTDDKSVIFDISGDNASAVTIPEDVKPSAVYVMNPKGHDYVFNGAFAGKTDLYKSMLGRADFTSGLSHTGKTIISEGTLGVQGNIVGPVALMARGTLAGSPVVKGKMSFEGALNYEGCRLMPEGTMTFAGNLDLPGNVYVETSLDDKVVVQGNLDLKGSNVFTIKQGTSKPAPGEYVLLVCNGEITMEDGAMLSLRGMDGVASSIGVKDHAIVLTVKEQRDPATGVVWTGANGGTWDYDTENFALGETSTTFVGGDEVCFNDAATQRVVTLDEKVDVAGLNFNFDKGTYTINGVGGFSGSGGLVKDGEGELQLNLTESDYTGATVINGGTLTVPTIGFAGKPSAIGASTAVASNLKIGKAVLKLVGDGSATDRNIQLPGDTATIWLNKSSASLSINGTVSGNGYLIKKGAGQLNFCYAGTNPFAGLIVKQGAVAQGDWRSTFGKVGSRVVFEGGSVKLIENKSMETIPTLNNVLVVDSGKTGFVYGSYRSSVAGSLIGAGTLNYVSGGVRSDWNVNTNNFNGVLKITGAEFRMTASSTDMKNATLDLGAGVWASQVKSGSSTALTTQTRRLGALTSSATDCTLAEGIWEIGYNNQEATYAGLLKNGTYYKVGTGRWTLSGSGSTASVIVKDGVLEAKGGSSSVPVTSGAITVQKGAKMIPSGYVQSVTVGNGGTLSAEKTDYSVSSSHILGNLTAQKGSTIKVRVRRSSSDRYYVNGNVTHQGDIIRVSFMGDITLSEGSTITVFSGFSSMTGSYVLVSDPGVEWDDSTLLTDGKLKVKTLTSGIETLRVGQDSGAYYDLHGRKVAEASQRDQLPAGIYIQNNRKVVVK